MSEPIDLVIRPPIEHAQLLINATVAGLRSPASRRVYGLWLRRFIEAGYAFERDGVANYLADLRERGLGAQSINQARAAVRKLTEEALIRQLIDERTARGILTLKGDPIRGQRVGNWLTIDAVKVMMQLPDRETPMGARDAALLAVMVACGLRRTEIAELDWTQYQEREARMCLIDVRGKGNRIRTVPVAAWAAGEVERWRGLQGTFEPIGRVWAHGRPKHRPERMFGGLSAAGVWWVVCGYGERMGVEIRPHDLRRTLARLMRKAGVDIEQIGAILGHAKIETTKAYLGGILELGRCKAGPDRVQWE